MVVKWLLSGCWAVVKWLLGGCWAVVERLEVVGRFLVIVGR